MSEEWGHCAQIPCQLFSKIIQINKYELIIAGYHNPMIYDWMRSDGIYKYNVFLDEWKLFIQYPSTLTTSYHTITYDKHKGKLYLYGQECNLIMIDIITHEFIVINLEYKIGHNPSSIFLQNKLHIIGGSLSHKHLVLNRRGLYNDAFKIIDNVFDPIGIIDIFDPEFYTKHNNKGRGNKNHGLIHLKSNNILLAFGGNCGGYLMRSMWKYDCKFYNAWKIVPNVILPKYINGHIITPDEKFIILFTNKTIHLFHIPTMKLIEHSICIPITGAFHAIIMDLRDPILCEGFIRKYYCNIISDLINIISRYYGQDHIIYLQQTRGRQHLQIKLSDIMNKFENEIKKHEDEEMNMTGENKLLKYKKIIWWSFRQLISEICALFSLNLIIVILIYFGFIGYMMD
eukprot:412253_1